MYLKQNIFTILLILVLISLGVLLFFVNPSDVLQVLMYVLAIFIFMAAVNFIVISRNYVGKDKNQLLAQSIFLLIVSVALILMPKDTQDWIFRIIIGLIFIIYPLFNLFASDYKKEQFLHDLPKYITGLVLVLSFGAVLKILFILLGVLLIGVGIWLIYELIRNRKNRYSPNVLVNIGIRYFFRKDSTDKWE